MEQADVPDALLHLVCEIKSTTVEDELRGIENQKIRSGEAHFIDALNVGYSVVTNADDLP